MPSARAWWWPTAWWSLRSCAAPRPWGRRSPSRPVTPRWATPPNRTTWWCSRSRPTARAWRTSGLAVTASRPRSEVLEAVAPSATQGLGDLVVRGLGIGDRPRLERVGVSAALGHALHRRHRRGLQHGDRDHDRDADQGGADEVGEVVAGVERRRGGLALGEQAVGALGRERRQDREADGAADLDARVDEAGGEPRVALGRARTSRASSAPGSRGRRRSRAGPSGPAGRRRSCRRPACGRTAAARRRSRTATGSARCAGRSAC